VPAWTAFVGLTLVVLVALLVLARASQKYVPDEIDTATGTETSDGSTGTFPEPADGGVSDRSPDRRDAAPTPVPGPGGNREDADAADDDGSSAPDGPAPPAGDGDGDAGVSEKSGAVVELERPRGRGRPPERVTVSAADAPTGVLLANVTVSQAIFGVVLVAGAWLTRIPASAFGLALAPGAVAEAAAVGVVLGSVLYVLNAAASSLASAGGVEYDETLRDLLTPSSGRGWATLLGVTLPVIAGFEELLFRAALIGVPAAGLGLPVWPLAVASSAVFAVGHGAQGRAGIVVTGLLGFGLAAAFVLSGSLVVVVAAHYVVNALEFVVGGYFGVEPFEG